MKWFEIFNNITDLGNNISIKNLINLNKILVTTLETKFNQKHEKIKQTVKEIIEELKLSLNSKEIKKFKNIICNSMKYNLRPRKPTLNTQKKDPNQTNHPSNQNTTPPQCFDLCTVKICDHHASW